MVHTNGNEGEHGKESVGNNARKEGRDDEHETNRTKEAELPTYGGRDEHETIYGSVVPEILRFVGNGGEFMADAHAYQRKGGSGHSQQDLSFQDDTECGFVDDGLVCELHQGEDEAEKGRPSESGEDSEDILVATRVGRQVGFLECDGMEAEEDSGEGNGEHGIERCGSEAMADEEVREDGVECEL